HVVRRPFCDYCGTVGRLRPGAKNLLAVVGAALLCAASPLALGLARADTLEGALALAYQNNPTLNAQRAGTRATDENVPQALAGYRPKVSITATGGEQSISTTSKTASSTNPGASVYSTSSGYNSPFSVGLTLTQTLFNGYQ